MSLKIRKQTANTTEQEILAYLRKHGEPVSFYQLYTELNYTSGKAQSALRRLQENGTVCLRKKVEKFKTFIYHKEFEIDPDMLEVEDENTIIFPVRLNRTVGLILQEVPGITPQYSSFMDVVKQALISFFQKELPIDLKRKTIQNAIAKGKITEEFGKQILGES